jgi:hypothetical protein
MAAGAIPPPLFFERRRLEGIFAFRNWLLATSLSIRHFQEQPITPSRRSPNLADVNQPARDGSLLQDI